MGAARSRSLSLFPSERSRVVPERRYLYCEPAVMGVAQVVTVVAGSSVRTACTALVRVVLVMLCHARDASDFRVSRVESASACGSAIDAATMRWS